MIALYDLTEADVSAKPFEAEAVYYCTDSKNIYFDSPREGNRIKMSSDTIILNTEANRTSILAPIANKIYVVLETGSMYIYSGSWVELSFGTVVVQPIWCNLSSGKATATYSHSSIRAKHYGVFVPDVEFADLASNISVTMAAGKATISMTSSYRIHGLLIVYKRQ